MYAQNILEREITRCGKTLERLDSILDAKAPSTFSGWFPAEPGIEITDGVRLRLQQRADTIRRRVEVMRAYLAAQST